MARSPLAGLLANRVVNRVSQGRPASMGGGGPSPPQAMQQGATQEQVQPAPQQEQKQQQQEQAQQEQREPPAPEMVARPQEEPLPQAPPPKVTEGLLEEAPAFSQQQRPSGGEVAPPPQVANQTEASSPVAPQAEEQFGVVPALLEPGLPSTIDDAPDRRTFAMEDPNPSKPVDTKSQARHGQNGPQYGFQTMGSWTSMAPNFSYRR